MKASELMRAMIDAGAPMEAVLIAVQAVEAKEAEIAARDAENEAKRAKDRDRKRSERARVRGQSVDSPEVVREAPLSRPLSPQTPLTPTHTPGITTRARKAEHRMPVDWEPILTPAAQRIVDGWPPGMFDRQLAKFRDHADDKGRTSKDWQAAFRTWISNADEWKPKNDNPRSTGGSTRNAAQAALERLQLGG